jgi:hypothetical protein
MRQQTARYFTDCSESPVLARAHSQAAAALYDGDEAEGLAEQMSAQRSGLRGAVRCGSRFDVVGGSRVSFGLGRERLHTSSLNGASRV